MSRARILVADDHPLVSEGLRELLEPEFALVGIVENGRDLLEAHDRLQPDVVVADVSMPLVNGIAAMRQLILAGSRARFVFLTMHAEASYATEAIEAGASAYVLKYSASDELLTALRDALAGRTYVTPRIAADCRCGKAGSSPRLTSRQIVVLRLLGEGRSSREIAALLDLSPRVVESHEGSIMDALGVRTVAELILYAAQAGVIQHGSPARPS